MTVKTVEILNLKSARFACMVKATFTMTLPIILWSHAVTYHIQSIITEPNSDAGGCEVKNVQLHFLSYSNICKKFYSGYCIQGKTFSGSLRDRAAKGHLPTTSRAAKAWQQDPVTFLNWKLYLSSMSASSNDWLACSSASCPEHH